MANPNPETIFGQTGKITAGTMTVSPLSSIHFVVTITCTNGHKETYKIGKLAGRAFVDSFVALATGNSDLFVVREALEEAVVGRCGICRARLNGEVEEIVADAPIAGVIADSSIDCIGEMVCTLCDRRPAPMQGVEARTRTPDLPSAWKCPTCGTWNEYENELS